jgi:3'-phosphoadenosine 5'-phosphosulfate (PAPS) 3'-phosphatase
MLEAELNAASTLAREAGAILLEIYASDFGVDFKSASDPVTEADRRADAFLVSALRERFPEDAIVAEESAAHGSAAQAQRVHRSARRHEGVHRQERRVLDHARARDRRPRRARRRLPAGRR